MQLLPIMFGLGCMVTVTFAMLSGNATARFLSVILAASWAVSNIAWLFGSLDKLAMMDGLIAALALNVSITHRSAWMRWFLALCVVQLALDIVYAIYGEAVRTIYSWLYNISFAAELLVVASTGGKNVGSHWRNGLRRFRGFLSVYQRQSR